MVIKSLLYLKNDMSHDTPPHLTLFDIAIR